jgi:hypothetical protein
LNGSIAAANKVAFNSGTWRDVGKNVAQGMVIGGLTGGTGTMMNAAATRLTTTGINGALNPFVAGFLGGANAGIGYVAGQGMFGDKSFRDQLNSPEGIFGFSASVVIGAFFGGNGAKMEEFEGGGLALDISLEIAGTLGGVLATTAYDTMEATANMIRNYGKRLD